MPAPPAKPQPGWVAVQPFPQLSAARSYVSGEPNGERLRIAYFRQPDGDRLYACVWFGPGAEGPPGQAHGGAMAAVLDEAMGAVTWMNGHRTVAARLTISFEQMLPLGSDTLVEAWIDLVEGRKVSTRARLLDASGTVIAEGDGLFVVLQPETLRRLSPSA